MADLGGTRTDYDPDKAVQLEHVQMLNTRDLDAVELPWEVDQAEVSRASEGVAFSAALVLPGAPLYLNAMIEGAVDSGTGSARLVVGANTGDWVDFTSVHPTYETITIRVLLPTGTDAGAISADVESKIATGTTVYVKSKLGLTWWYSRT
jgi:hypothetical protein